ncbi:Zinc finger BED domain-containing protein RICESLEEPER 3 [Glycine max]|nr:Zinc finger BED domain-containing protein RICESLEEPER 3 [Glycine max]
MHRISRKIGASKPQLPSHFSGIGSLSRHDRKTRIRGYPSEPIPTLTGNIRVDRVWVRVRVFPDDQNSEKFSENYQLTFQETAKQLRIPCTKKLSLDCPTRWNSTYKMLDVAISYEDVFSRLKQRETQYSCFPSDSQWEFAKEVCKRLAIFNDIIEMIYGTKYPTANIYFPQICEIKMTLSEWVNSPNEVIQKMAGKMLQKFDSYWINRIRNLCYDLVSEYQAKEHQDSTSSFESPNVVSDEKSKLCDYDRYIQRKKRARTSTMKTELDHYLEEEFLPRSSDFDILMWWKLNELKDALAIPISTVAFESKFSIGGQILTPHHSQLHYTTLEALICSKSWLWNSETAGSRSIEESTFTDEIESDDEGGSLVSSITQCLQD